MSSMTPEKLQRLLEAALMAYGKPMSLEKMVQLFDDDLRPTNVEIKNALGAISEAYVDRGVELKEVASGYRFQAKQDYAEWIARLWEEKAPKYSRALLETLSLIAYRQPITRSEIEDVRGVSVSSHIVKTLLEREWVRVVGYRDVPGRPALYATTREFLDYFNLANLSDLPPLSEIRDLDTINAELNLEGAMDDDSDPDSKHLQDNELSEEGDSQSEMDLSAETTDSTEHSELTATFASSEEMGDREAVYKLESTEESRRELSLREQFEESKDQQSDEELLEDLTLTGHETPVADESVFDDAYEPAEHPDADDELADSEKPKTSSNI